MAATASNVVVPVDPCSHTQGQVPDSGMYFCFNRSLMDLSFGSNEWPHTIQNVRLLRNGHKRWDGLVRLWDSPACHGRRAAGVKKLQWQGGDAIMLLPRPAAAVVCFYQPERCSDSVDPVHEDRARRRIVQLRGKRVRITGLPYDEGHEFLAYRGRVGTASAVLDGNSLEDLRLPVALDGDGKVLDILVDLVEAIPTDPARQYQRRWPRKASLYDESRSPPRRPDMVLTLATRGYWHWLTHLQATLSHLGYRNESLSVCVSDNETEALVRARGMHPIVMKTQLFNAIDFSGLKTPTNAFTSTTFRQALALKQRCIWTQALESLPARGTLLFIDADITLLRDPVEAMPSSDAFDAVFADDSFRTDFFRTSNVGFFLLRKTRRTMMLAKAYMQRMLPYNDVARPPADQHTFNMLLRDGLQRALELRVHTLSVAAFPNGRRFYEDRHVRPVNVSALAAIHHNWISGDANKWRRAVQYNGILRPGEPWAAFLERARASAVTMPPWDGKQMAPMNSTNARRHEGKMASRRAIDAQALALLKHYAGAVSNCRSYLHCSRSALRRAGTTMYDRDVKVD